MSARQGVPTFYLYGEPHRVAAEGFVHVEPLDDRSRPSEWTIKPHAHADLAHLFYISDGGGTMWADGHKLTFTAPCLLAVPPTAVHGFVWLEESTGSVVTLAMRYLQALSHFDGTLMDVFEGPRAVQLDDPDRLAVDGLIVTLMRELAWSAAGHRAAVDAALLAVLVIALRKSLLDARPLPRPGHRAAVVAHFRERIEQRYRRRETVAVHAAALGVSETALRAACAAVAGASPMQMLDQRVLLEARRLLIYSNLSVSEIGYSLGFADPAYFTRFFGRHLGVAPSAYRVGGSPTPS